MPIAHLVYIIVNITKFIKIFTLPCREFISRISALPGKNLLGLLHAPVSSILKALGSKVSPQIWRIAWKEPQSLCSNKKEIPIRSKFQESLWSVENVVPEYEYVNLKRTVEDIPSGKIKMGNGDAQAIMGRGCDRFIQKPFNLQGLSQTYSINPEQSFPI